LSHLEMCQYDNGFTQENLEQLRYMMAKAYVPYQIYSLKYSLEQALMVGTLFPELVKPWPAFYYEEVVKK